MSDTRIMQQQDNVAAAGLGTAMGLIYSWLSLFSFFPAWIGQALVTVIVSSMAIVANHFIKRELNRRWPERKRKPGDTTE